MVFTPNFVLYKGSTKITNKKLLINHNVLLAIALIKTMLFKLQFSLAAALSILLLSKANCQLVTNTGQSPQGLVQNVLLGPGVVVSNIMFNGSNTAIGSFSATGTNLGINQGIVMTTGTVLNNGSGPQGPNNLPSAGMDNNVGGSGLLSNLIGGTQTYNAAILEFDFIPYSDTVKFKYVFGSDEYPEFAPPNNSGYNDVFGFFISGPGIVGMQNIAQLPNNGGIVSINNVNAITNPQYFNANGDGNMAPYNSSPFYIQYDGFTDVLEAISQVQCGETYHLILAIADVGDGSWDSGIFLEANSLSSLTPVTVSYALSQQAYPDPSWMAEGCVTATVTLQRNNNLNSSLTIPIQTSGTAQNILDYTGVPNSITFPVGQNTTSFTITSLPDALVEGLESIIMNFSVTDPCGNITPIPLTINIQDVAPLILTIPDTSVLCPGTSLSIVSTISGGVPPYSYLWSNGATTTSISVIANTNSTIFLTVSDNCSGQSVSDSAIISVPIYPPLALTASNDITEICPNISQTIYANVSGGSGVYIYSWMQGNTMIGTSDSITVSPSISTNYMVSVTDNCGNALSDTVSYTITSPPLIVTNSPVIQVCPGDSAYISASASGGYGNYYFLWPATGETTAGIWVHPTASSIYQVIVSDECQTFTVSGFSQVLVVKPMADFSIISQSITEGLPISFLNQTQNGYGYTWYFGDGGTSNDIHPVHTYPSEGTYLVTLYATDLYGCKDSVSMPIVIQEELYIYIPNSFIPDENRINDYFSGSFVGVEWIKIEIFNRWGELVFESEDLNFAWDGKYNGEDIQSGCFTWKLRYRPRHLQELLMTGHVNIIR